MYRDANGNEFESYEDACRYYGADTPAQLAAEAAADAQDEADAETDRRFTDALVFDRFTADYLLNGDFAECPF